MKAKKVQVLVVKGELTDTQQVKGFRTVRGVEYGILAEAKFKGEKTVKKLIEMQRKAFGAVAQWMEFRIDLVTA